MYANGLQKSSYLIDLIDLTDLRDLTDPIDLIDLTDLTDLTYLTYLTDLTGLTDLMDLTDLTDLTSRYLWHLPLATVALARGTDSSLDREDMYFCFERSAMNEWLEVMFPLSK